MAFFADAAAPLPDDDSRAREEEAAPLTAGVETPLDEAAEEEEASLGFRPPAAAGVLVTLVSFLGEASSYK